MCLCSPATETQLRSDFASVAMVTPVSLLVLDAAGNASAFHGAACKHEELFRISAIVVYIVRKVIKRRKLNYEGHVACPSD